MVKSRTQAVGRLVFLIFATLQNIVFDLLIKALN